MRGRLAIAGALAPVVFGAGSAVGLYFSTPVATGDAGSDRVAVDVVDSVAGIPVPLGPWVIVRTSGPVSCGLRGGPYRDDGTPNGGFSDSRTCGPVRVGTSDADVSKM